jgi:hypothetical protein
MGPISEAVQAWLDEQEFEYDAKDEEGVFVFRYKGGSGIWSCFIFCREQEEQLVLYSEAPVAVAEELRVDMAEFILRANYGASIGCFEMDVDDGEIRYRTGLDVTDTQVEATMLRNIVLANLLMMDTYLPGILAVVHGGVAPHVAIQKIETGGE